MKNNQTQVKIKLVRINDTFEATYVEISQETKDEQNKNGKIITIEDKSIIDNDDTNPNKTRSSQVIKLIHSSKGAVDERLQ